MTYRKGHRRPADRLRRTVEALPRRTREAMLRGLQSNRIIAGAYVDSRSGGVCPMLAAHRNGGRTDLASFARTWDFFTGARKARRATRREVATLRSYLEISLIADGDEYLPAQESISDAAARIRSERAARRAASVVAETVQASRDRVPTGERDRGNEPRRRSPWAWMRPTRRYDVYSERLAAAAGEHAEQRATRQPSVADAEQPRLPGRDPAAQTENAEASPGRV
jgi:hypothetical protein